VCLCFGDPDPKETLSKWSEHIFSIYPAKCKESLTNHLIRQENGILNWINWWLPQKTHNKSEGPRNPWMYIVHVPIYGIGIEGPVQTCKCKHWVKMKPRLLVSSAILWHFGACCSRGNERTTSSSIDNTNRFPNNSLGGHKVASHNDDLENQETR